MGETETSAPAADESTVIVTGTGQREAWRERVLPQVEPLSGGLWSLPVPFPDNPLRYTLTYLVPGDQGVVVVDPGWRSDEGWEALVAGLATAGASVEDVTGIVVTHIHPDHHGMSGRLRAASGAWVAMHPAERDTLERRLTAAHTQFGGLRARIEGLMRPAGAPEPVIDEFLADLAGRIDRDAEPPAEPDLLLEDGDEVPLPGRRMQAIWTPGHTPGHLCLREARARVLMTGDHVLPRITPNLGVNSASEKSPLSSFLNSLERIAEFDDHEALPAHEYRFRGLAARTADLRDHHRRRCAEIGAVVDAVGAPTIWELAERLTWSRPWAEVGRMMVAAVSETLAHAVYLVEQGELAWAIGGEHDPMRLRRAV
ncbi:MBL fold metallo-hydrolase [Nocardia sp. alder85J]|uniref:MBL fold metallo-hydrolase n=1 Tax=Nocardia sp. alder85J TaxID=2862949 RepID=UPI001CD739B0|nr:MBL fold metallo-hydrolase [Nocardia sp. alder85J]MCX4096754.1 MBL fold metallo-hydrolase [Nocardia sp. alder85J]